MFARRSITHRFLACGAQTRIVEADGRVSWTYPLGTRDGFVLPGGNLLLAITRGQAGFPKGGVREITPEGKVVLEVQGTQDEVDTADRLPDGSTVFTEAGPNPRLVVVDRRGREVGGFALSSQRGNTHMQQRMTRHQTNGNFIVPHLLDRIIREYTPDGNCVWEAKTPNMPFTAIRLPNNHILAGCTHGNLVVELDRRGRIVWSLENKDLPSPTLKDCCGVQWLPSGNIVVTSYATGRGEVKLQEITRDKQVVWSHTDQNPFGIHHFQILDTNGVPLAGRARK